MDPFDPLPTEIIHTILSFLPFVEGTRTTILSKTFFQAWSTIPILTFVDTVFNKTLAYSYKPMHGQETKIRRVREKFANYVDRTVTGYQQQNIPITTLRLSASCVSDIKIANMLEQSILKAKEHEVQKVHLHILSIPVSSNLLHTIFALKQRLLELTLLRCDLLKMNIQDYGVVNCSSLRKLGLWEVTIDKGVFLKLMHSFPLIEEIELFRCKGPETIQVANLPKLKWLDVVTIDNQIVHVKRAISLETMIYHNKSCRYSLYQLPIKSAQNLKNLHLCCNITDQRFHNLIARLPVLERLTLYGCNKLWKINVSSCSLRYVCLMKCKILTKVKIDAPNLKKIEYVGLSIPSSSFASEGSGKSVSRLCLALNEASSLQGSSEILMKCRGSLYYYIKSTEISFNRDAIVSLKGFSAELEELSLSVHSPSSTYPTLMQHLLLTFSPKIFSVSCDSDEDFINYLCEELLQAEDDDQPNDGSTNYSSKSWRNYFKHAKFEDRDACWALDSWKRWADAMQNLGDHYILKLSCA